MNKWVILEIVASMRPRNGVDLQNQLPKIAAVGKRNLAQQTLEIVISGYDSLEKAEAAFRREIVKLIEVKTNGLVDHASTR
jgi:hypothetical protein